MSRIPSRSILFALVSLACLQMRCAQAAAGSIGIDKKSTQKSYVCPPHFMRLSYKCYYFSNTTATWQDAYWRCRDMNTTIATIKNGNQDKIIRRTLDHNNSVPLERWIGGRYDWGTNTWRWAVSGKPVQFHKLENGLPLYKEDLNWHCIVLDPQKHYHWSARRCTEEKHFVCQTKLRKVDMDDKRKLQRHYNSKLNEVDVPEMTANVSPAGSNRTRHSNVHNYDNNQLDNTAAAFRPRELRLSKAKERAGGDLRRASEGQRKQIRSHAERSKLHAKSKRRQQKAKERNAHRQINYMTYFEATRSPLHPRVAVEQFSF